MPMNPAVTRDCMTTFLIIISHCFVRAINRDEEEVDSEHSEEAVWSWEGERSSTERGTTPGFPRQQPAATSTVAGQCCEHV